MLLSQYGAPQAVQKLQANLWSLCSSWAFPHPGQQDAGIQATNLLTLGLALGGSYPPLLAITVISDQVFSETILCLLRWSPDPKQAPAESHMGGGNTNGREGHFPYS